MSMTPFERLANDIVVGIELSRDRIEDFGYQEDTQYALSCINASLIIWLTASEEKRLGGAFRDCVVDQLPDQNDPAWGHNIRPIPGTSLKERMQALWGIRVAFTHGAGDLTRLSNRQNRLWAESATRIVPGCQLSGDLLNCSGMNFHLPIRSIVQVQEIL